MSSGVQVSHQFLLKACSYSRELHDDFKHRKCASLGRAGTVIKAKSLLPAYALKAVACLEQLRPKSLLHRVPGPGRKHLLVGHGHEKLCLRDQDAQQNQRDQNGPPQLELPRNQQPKWQCAAVGHPQKGPICFKRAAHKPSSFS